VTPRSEESKLIIHVITFELTQHICPRYINVTDVTDGQTTYDSNTALALRASRGNNNLHITTIRRCKMIWQQLFIVTLQITTEQYFKC